MTRDICTFLWHLLNAIAIIIIIFIIIIFIIIIVIIIVKPMMENTEKGWVDSQFVLKRTVFPRAS